MIEFKDRARRYHTAIKTTLTLLNEWDPIGISDVPEAQDEYDSYVPGIHKMLVSRSTEKEVFEYLWDVETQHMGLLGNRGHTEAVAGKLVQLIDRIEGGEDIQKPSQEPV
ncbi:MAG: hypothetical protein JRI70_10905 [Deltaproteobacteria bacterium]|nr:hypothetical protein [Deltaproteobacteria bacterium]